MPETLLRFSSSWIYYHLEINNKCDFFFSSMKSMAPAALFLAAKVEEQPKKLEHVIKVAHTCLHPQESLPDTRSEVGNYTFEKVIMSFCNLNLGCSAFQCSISKIKSLS